MRVLFKIFTTAFLVCGLLGQTHDLDYKALAERIVERMQLRSGERVLLLGHAGRFQELVPHLRRAIREEGAVDLGLLQVEAPAGVPATKGGEANRAALKEMLAGVDLTVKLPGAMPPAPAYLAIQDLLREKRGRAIHFHWEGAFPLSEGLPPQSEIDAVYQKALLDTDYRALAARQEEFERELRRHGARVTTPSGTDLRFRVGDRPVTKQDGNASAERAARARNLIDREVELPSGAIRVAPLEESVEGVIAFPPSIWGGQEVDGLRLRIEKGKVVDVQARRGVEAVRKEMRSAGETGRSFREFALGFNPLLAIPESPAWIPYYGYGAGVVRLSLGDNTELGGRVGGGYVRWNFFADATVSTGDRVWVRSGRMLEEPRP